MLQKTLLFLVLSFSINLCHSQILFDGNESFDAYKAEIQKQFEEGQLNSKSLKKANRLDWMYKNRLYPNGVINNYQNELKSSISSFSSNTDLDSIEWHQIGNGQIINAETEVVLGNGRISFIEFHPEDHNRIYVGSPSGCVWISNDNAASWEVLESVPSCRGFSDMHFDTNTGDIYLLTGDSDGRVNPFQGLYKSTDDGASWQIIDIPGIAYAKKILCHPTAQDKLYLVADKKLYRSSDNGVEWDMVEELTDVHDFEFIPNTDSTIYAFANDTLFGSTDLGANFTPVFTHFDTLDHRRSELEIVQIDDTCRIYLAITGGPTIGGLGNTEGIFESTDYGLSFELIDTTDEFSAGQSNYNFLFAVHPSIKNQFFIGWVKLFWSDPITMHWTEGYDLIEEFRFHPDHHCHSFDPKDANCVLVGNDGGIYRSCDLGATWEDITGNLQLGQIYHFNNSNICNDLMVVGLQDNGSAIFHEDKWKKLGPGDGISCGFTATTNDTVFYTTQFSTLSRLDSLTTVLESETFDYLVNSVSPVDISFSGGFSNLFEPSLCKPGLSFYKSFNNLFKTNNSGENWEEAITTDFTISDLYLSGVNSDYLIISNREIEPEGQNIQVQYSIDEGISWVSKNVSHVSIDSLESKPIPTCIAMSNHASFDIWLGINKNNLHKILRSSDLGNTWTDYSEGLPDIQINDIIHQPHSNGDLYVATDVGVYYRNNTMDEWKCITTDIGPTLFSELRISNVAEKIRAATFGYGIWETDLINIETSPPFANMNCDMIQLCPNEEYILTHTSSYTISELEWHVEGTTLTNPSIDSIIVSFTEPGFYDATIIVSNSNGLDTITIEDKFMVIDNSLTIDSMELVDGSYILSIPEEIVNPLWSTDETTDSIVVTEGGWYFVEGYNDYGCPVTDSIYLNTISNAYDVESDKCRIYPNPTVNELNISCQYVDAIIEISDYTGRRIVIQDYSSGLKIDLSAGLYLVIVKDRQGQLLESHKLVVLE